MNGGEWDGNIGHYEYGTVGGIVDNIEICKNGTVSDVQNGIVDDEISQNGIVGDVEKWEPVGDGASHEVGGSQEIVVDGEAATILVGVTKLIPSAMVSIEEGIHQPINSQVNTPTEVTLPDLIVDRYLKQSNKGIPKKHYEPDIK
ncbi:hypothetical protein Dimus_013247, partial [Dionaea muscipula]